MKDYFRLRVKDIIQETTEAVTLRFKQPFFGRVRYKCGQFITLVMDIDGKEYRRSYSINSTPGIDDDISVTVKKIPGGQVSAYICEELKRGDVLKVMQPMGNFTFEADKNANRQLVLFGAGSGITPLMGIMKAALFLEPHSTVTLVYSNKSRLSVIFADQIQRFQEQFPDRLFVTHLISNEGERLDIGAFEKYLSGGIVLNTEKAEFYLCGPDSYMDLVKEGLSAMGVGKEKVFYESFTQKRVQSAQEAYEVVFKTRKSEERVAVPAGKSLLDIGLDYGLRMRFACFNGACGTCKCRCVTGSVRMAVDTILTEEEKRDGYVLACVGYPASEGVVIELD